MGTVSITFRRDFGLWWPDYDHKPEKCYARVMNRLSDVDVTIAECRRRGRTALAVQAGGHAGVWPLRLAGAFQAVYTFEPEPELCECMRQNINLLATASPEVHKRVHIHEDALGERPGCALMVPHCSAGSWRVAPEGSVRVPMTTIDIIVGGRQCDAIVLDVEGYEVEALQGAAETIKRSRPVIHVEELSRSALTIQGHLRGLGYKLHRRVHGDAIYV